MADVAGPMWPTPGSALATASPTTTPAPLAMATFVRPGQCGLRRARIDQIVERAFVQPDRHPRAVLRDEARGVTLSGVPAVIDGDTIRLASRVVQIFGIDAPKSAHKFWNSGTPYPCGAMATAHLAYLTLVHTVECKGEDKLPLGEILVNCRLGKHD